jgi:lantibiotic modifying enzyme
LGGAHGLGGNLNIILSSIKYNNVEPQIKRYHILISASVSFLLRHLINGNFTTSVGSKNIKLVHFCHGAPGIVTALAKFTEIFPESSIQMGIKEVIQVNLDHIWKFGVLKKGFGLCHGISGNAYTFISPSIQQVFPEK